MARLPAAATKRDRARRAPPGLPLTASGRAGRVEPAVDHLSVVGEERDVATLLAIARQPGHACDFVSLDVVRPDDNACTQLRRQGGNQVGKGVSSQVSSKVIPAPANLLVDVAPRRSAQRAWIAFCHQCSSRPASPASICNANSHVASSNLRNRAIASLSTVNMPSSRPAGVWRAMIWTVSRP